MQYKSFIIPTEESIEAEETLNLFLRSHIIISVRSEFANLKNCWTFLVEYLDKEKSITQTGKKKDYINLCTKEEFAVFTKIREWRKKLAAENNFPPYVILTDDQIYEIIKQKVTEKNKLGKIKGIGNEKIEKYGDAIIKLLGISENEDSKIPF